MKLLIISNNEICYNPRLLKAADYFFEKDVEVDVFNPITGAADSTIYNEIKLNSQWSILENDISKKTFVSAFKWALVSSIHKGLQYFWNYFKLKIAFKFYLNKGLIFNNINPKTKYDYILINLVDNLPFAIWLAEKNGAKIIYDSQEYFVGQYQKYSKELLDWVKRAERDYLKKVDLVLTTTNVMKERLISDYQLTIPVIRVRNTPSKKMIDNLDNKLPKNVDEPIKLIWHGMGIYLNNTRGVHILIEALAKCKENVHLYLQGLLNNDQEAILNNYLQQYNLFGRVHVKSPANPFEIVNSLVNYDIGLIGEIPEEDNQILTSSNKLFDYINAGLAVIASNLPGLNETVITNNIGINYEAGNSYDLACQIDKLASSMELLNAYKLRSKKIASTELYWEKDYDTVWETIKNE